MALNFKMSTHRKDRDWIVIHVSGDFDGMSAWELIHKMNEYSETCGKIEINTSGLKELVPFGLKVFLSHAALFRKSPSRYVVTGPKAMFLSGTSPFEPLRA